MRVGKGGFTQSDNEPDIQNFNGVVGGPPGLFGGGFGHQKTMEQY